MTNKRGANALSKLTRAGAMLVPLLLTQACGKLDPPRSEYDMGEKVRVGSLTYNVIETTWKNQLGEFPSARIPERNFLLVRISITNSGGGDRSIPAMQMQNDAGDTFPEIMQGQGIDHWLGLLRRVPPAQTEEGWILFDVPTNSYHLKIEDTDSAGAEQVALIAIKLSIPPDATGGGLSGGIK